MNASEQKLHRVVTKGLGERLDVIEPVVDAIDHRVTEAYTEFDRRLREERTFRTTLATDQRTYVDHEDHELRQVAEARFQTQSESIQRLAIDLYRFQQMAWWERARWILTGRVSW